MISSSVTIQIKAIEQYFPVVLFIMLYKVVAAFEFMNETIQIKATEQYFLVVLFIMLYNVILTSRRLKCEHLNGSYQAALRCSTVQGPTNTVYYEVL